MADPLGLINSGNSPLRPTGPTGINPARPPAGGIPTDPNGNTFKDVLLKSIEQANQLQQDATQAADGLATGQRTDVENVLLATQKADLAFRALLSVRNKVQAAFDEVKQVRI